MKKRRKRERGKEKSTQSFCGFMADHGILFFVQQDGLKGFGRGWVLELTENIGNFVAKQSTFFFFKSFTKCLRKENKNAGSSIADK